MAELSVFKGKTEKEIADMTIDEIDRAVQSEIMFRGIREYEEPGPEPLKPTLKTSKYFCVGDLYFTTMSLAEKALALKPLIASYNWDIGSEVKYPATYSDTIKVVDLPSKEEVLRNAEAFTEWSNLHQVWSYARENYDRYKSRKADLVKDIFSEWNRCKDAAKDIKDVLTAFEEYKDLAGSDEVAMKFLVKTFGQKRVDAALGINQVATPSEEVTA